MHFSSALVAALAVFSAATEAGPLVKDRVQTSTGSVEHTIRKTSTEHLPSATHVLFSSTTSKSSKVASSKPLSTSSSENELGWLAGVALSLLDGAGSKTSASASVAPHTSSSHATSSHAPSSYTSMSHLSSAPLSTAPVSSPPVSSVAVPVITSSATLPTQTAGIIGYPCTSTNTMNSAVTAYASCTTWSGGVQAMFSGSSTQVRSGVSMQVTLVSTASAYVGTLTDWNLYSAVSTALMTACSPQGGFPTSATVTAGQTGTPPSWTTCADIPSITGIVYATGSASNIQQVTDYGGNDWYSDGTLQISVPEVSFTDEQSLLALVSSLASSLNSSSMNWPNYKATVGPYCDPLSDDQDCNTADFWSGPNCVNYTAMDAYGDTMNVVQPYPPEVAMVPGYIQTIMTTDTASAPDWPVQFMSISLTADKPEAFEFVCADGALITDGLALLPLLPGLDFLAWLAVPAFAVSATCAAIENTSKGG